MDGSGTLPPDWMLENMARRRAELDEHDPDATLRVRPDQELQRRLARERMLARDQATGPDGAPLLPWGVADQTP